MESNKSPPPSDAARPLHVRIVASSVGALLVAVFLCPFDVVTRRLQGAERLHQAAAAPPAHVARCGGPVYTSRGVLCGAAAAGGSSITGGGGTAGTTVASPSAMPRSTSSPPAASSLSAFSAIKSRLRSPLNATVAQSASMSPTAEAARLRGGGGGGGARSLPIDAGHDVRFECCPRSHAAVAAAAARPSLRSVLGDIVRNEGVTSLWRGLWPTVLMYANAAGAARRRTRSARTRARYAAACIAPPLSELTHTHRCALATLTAIVGVCMWSHVMLSQCVRCVCLPFAPCFALSVVRAFDCALALCPALRLR